MTRLVSPSGLHVFRIAYSLYLLLEVLTLVRYYHLTFDSVPYVEMAGGMYGLFLWMPVIVCLGLGVGAFYSAILNYLFSLIYFSGHWSHTYHAHFIAITINLLLIVIPTDRTGKVPVYYYYCLAAFGLGFVYLDSVIFKLGSQVWRGGSAVWLGCSYLPIAACDLTPLLNSESLMLVLNYGTMMFEAGFFFFLFTKWRLIGAIIGMALHFGIAILYPLKLFGLQFIVFLILLVPLKCWRGFTFVGWPLAWPDFIHRRYAIGALLALETGLLAFAIYKNVAPNVEEPLASRRLAVWLGKLTGLCNHPLFLHEHFVPRAVYKITHHGVLLPFTKENGLCDPLLDGIAWKQWSSGTLDEPEKTIIRFTADWAHHQGVNLDHAEFTVFEKRIEPPGQFQKDYLRRMMAREFKECGALRYKDRRWTFEKRAGADTG